MSVYTCAYKTDPQVMDLWCYGPFFMVTAVGFVLYPRRWSHQAMFAQGLVLPRRLWQPFLFNDLSTRLGHPDNSRHRSAVMHKRCFCDVCWLKQGCCSFSNCWTLTFPVFVLLAHRPHADLFVDHIHAGETASKIRDKRWDFFHFFGDI